MSRLMEDLPSFPSTASTSQEDHEGNSGTTSSRKLRVTLLSSEWRSTKGGLSTINRELAIQLAKHPNVEVSVYLPKCSEEDKRVAASHNVLLIEAEEMPGYDNPVDWLSFLPENHSVDCVIGHGAVLGRQVQGIKRQRKCKWIQFVHTAPEELGMYKCDTDAISRGANKHQAEVKLCEKADQVVAVGPKLAEAFSGYLRACGKDQDVLNLTPGIFSEFSDVKQATEERTTFSVLVFGRGDNDDFKLKGCDIAARAIAELKDDPQPYKLLFVGAPRGEEGKVKDLLLEQGIKNSQLIVRCFDGSREQLAQLFCEVDLAIMPSRTKGFGLAALEALSAGLPVLVSENSGLGEALKKVSFGSYCVVKSENPEAWASAIRIIREKDRETRLDESKTLREKYAIKHNWQDHCNKLIEIMRNISQGSSEGVKPMKKGKRPLPPSGVPDPKQPRLPRDEEESCPTAPVDCRKDCVSDNQSVAEEGQAHGHSVSSAENLAIQIDAVEQGGSSSSQNVTGKENVEDRRGTFTQEVLARIADKFIQKIDPSDEEGFNGFLQYMEKVRQTIVVDVKTGSLIITVRCTSLRILDDLWRDYCTGHLQEVAQRYLVTEDILQQWGLDSVQLTLTISEEAYKAYRKNFLTNEGIVEPVANTSLPDDLLSVSDLNAIDTEGEQTLPTDSALSEFSQDLSPCKASTSQEVQGNSSSSSSSKELRAISLKGSKEVKTPLTSGSTLASRLETLEGIVEAVKSTSPLEDLLSVSDLDAIKTEGEKTLPTDASLSKFSRDLSPPCTTSTSQQGQGNSNKLRITLLSSEWRSTRGSLSTINRELAIQLAKQPSVEVSVYLPQCSEKDKRVAASYNVTLIEAEEMPGLEPDLWLSCLPEDHDVDCVIGRGAVLGRQAQLFKWHYHCKWIQIVHTAPGELGMFKEYEEHVSKGEDKHQVELELCKLADQVVAVGPKLAEALSGYLRPCGKDQDVLNLTPGIFSEFTDVKQPTEERKAFNVLVFGDGDNEDFQLKGYDIAAQAITELKDMTYKLVFAGATSGEEVRVADALLKQGIDRSQLRVRRFNESREQLARLFCEVDLAIMPSRTEGFGLAALEALSAGLPVLVSGNSGFAEALKKVSYGSSCVVTSDDPKDWANAIRAVRDKDREMRVGQFEVLRGAYAKMYSWKEQCDKLVERMKMISLEGSKRGKRPLSSSSNPASKVPKYLGDEGWDSLVLVKLLKKEYKRRSQLRPLLWDSTIQLPIEQVYTRLKIVSRGKSAIQIKDDDVKVFDIFKVPDIGEEVMTIVEGSPGIGKTTFCLKLAYDWAYGNIPSECSFPKFEFVFLLKCRDIDGDIMESISDQLLPRDEEKSVEKLWHLMKDIRDQERLMLIILDGLDELPEKSRHHVDELLNRRILAFCYVLATTRQERGIEVRESGVVFDIHLEIKGYTESDSTAYVTRHFETIDQSLKGERLIEEMEQNTFLHALRSNPLNLLLLCVVYEDYDGNLPTSRTELYQVIVQCLLRRYCAKHNLAVPEDNNTLQKRFEEDILALGELAWACLLNDRQSFREGELAEREVENQNLVARKIGLLYKEESLKRINPQHEYWFLHNTFQEYLAAAFIAHKLLRGELKVFEYMKFDDLFGKYPQVFLFVSGILGEKATVLFTQIGKQLKKKRNWHWRKCNKQVLQFFVESLSESGHAEQMALTLCSFIPFPQEVNIELPAKMDNIFEVVKAFRKVRNLQPVKLTIREHSGSQSLNHVAEYMQSCSQIQTLSIFAVTMTSALANAVHNGLIGNTTLSEFSLQVDGCIPYDAAVVISELLGARIVLKKVKFQLGRVSSETLATSIEPALSGDALSRSVDLNIRGSLSDTAVHSLGKLLSDKALTSFSLNISGDVQELVAAVISKGIQQQTALKSLAFGVDGNLSLSGMKLLQTSLLKNRSLNDLVLNVRGEIPDNWQFVVENLRSVKKGSVNCTFNPDPGSSVTCNQVAHFRPAVVEMGLGTKHHLTVVLWGDLKCDGADNLCEILVPVLLTSLTLKVHGNLSDGVANIIKRYIGRQNTLSALTIDTWRKLAPGTGTLLQELSDKNVTVQVKEHDVSVVPKEACSAVDVSIDNPASLTPMFSEVRNTRKKRINLKIINDHKVISDWPRLLGDALAVNTSLTTLDLTVSNYTMNPGIGKDLGDSLLRSSSLTVLSLTISDYSNMAKGWECTLINSLAKMVSLTTLSLSIDDRGDVRKFEEDLMAVKSLSTLSIVINGRNLTYFWGEFLQKCLKECNSLTKLYLTENNYVEREYNPYSTDFNDYRFSYDSRKMPVTWVQGLGLGLAHTTSLKELNMTINNIMYTDSIWKGLLFTGLECNNSITSLTVTVSDYEYLHCEKLFLSLKRCLAKNKSLTTLTLTVNDYREGKRHPNWLHQLKWEDFPENSSLTELNLTVNIRSEVSEDWLPRFCDYLIMNCSSLRTVRLRVNNRCATSKSRIYDLSKLRLKYRSLSTFELSVTFYGE